MILHFDQPLVRTLLTHSTNAPAHRPAFAQEEPAPPGLWLVGDEGVYLISNGLPALAVSTDANARNVVCYAREANPQTLGRDLADDAKRASFGGDDGVDFLAADELLRALAVYPPGQPLALDVTAQTIGILTPGRPKRARTA